MQQLRHGWNHPLYRSAGIAQFEAGCRETRPTRDNRTSHGPDWEVTVSAKKCPPVRNAMQVVKTVLITLWISAATLGTMYGVAWLKARSAASADGGGIRADFKTKTLSIPVFAEGKVIGYAVLRFEGAIDAAFAASANPLWRLPRPTRPTPPSRRSVRGSTCRGRSRWTAPRFRRTCRPHSIASPVVPSPTGSSLPSLIFFNARRTPPAADSPPRTPAAPWRQPRQWVEADIFRSSHCTASRSMIASCGLIVPFSTRLCSEVSSRISDISSHRC